MDSIGNGIVTALVTVFVIGGLLVLGAWGISSWLSDDSIRSDRPIVPEIELVILDNKLDTVYVYREP